MRKAGMCAMIQAMTFSWMHRSKIVQIVCTCMVPVLIVFSVLWKGGKSLEATWLLAGVAFLIVFFCDARKNHHTRPDALLWCTVIGFALWTCLSFWFSSTQNYGLDEVLRTLSFALLFLWAFCVSKEEGAHTQRLWILKAVAMATLVACFIGMLVYMFQPVNRFVGTFFDARFHTDYWPNAWAQYLLLSWPIVLWFMLHTQKKLGALVKILVLALVFACLLLSYSRGAMIAFTGQIALLAWFAYQDEKSDLPVARVGKYATGVFLFGLLFFTWMNHQRQNLYDVQSVSEKVTFTADEGTSSASERSQFWSQAILLANERPIFGWGPYSFRFIQPRLQQHVLATSDHPHNVFLKLAMERGWPAAGLFLLLLWLIFGRYLRELGMGSRGLGLEAILVVSVAGVLAHNLIDYNLQFVGIALPFWLFLGFISGMQPDTEGKNLNKKLVQIVEVSIATVLILVAVVEAFFLVLSSAGRHAEAAGRGEEALGWYELAKPEIFSRDMHLSRTQILFKHNRINEASSALDDYFMQNGEDVRAWKRKGDIALANNQHDLALAEYRKAYELGKYNDASVINALFQTLLTTGRKEEADTRKLEFDALLSEYTDAVESNTHFIALSPNVEELIVLAGTLADTYPTDAPLYIVLGARIDRKAKEERAKIQARPPGYLW